MNVKLRLKGEEMTNTNGDNRQVNHDMLKAFIVDVMAVCKKHSIMICGEEDEYADERFIACHLIDENGQDKGEIGSIISIEPGDECADDCIEDVSSWNRKG